MHDPKMVSAVLRLKSEDITFNSAVETAAAVEQTLGDVRAIAGQGMMGAPDQSMTGDPGVHAISQTPQAARTAFGVGRGQASQRGLSVGEVSAQGFWGVEVDTCGGCARIRTPCAHIATEWGI